MEDLCIDKQLKSVSVVNRFGIIFHLISNCSQNEQQIECDNRGSENEKLLEEEKETNYSATLVNDDEDDARLVNGKHIDETRAQLN